MYILNTRMHKMRSCSSEGTMWPILYYMIYIIKIYYVYTKYQGHAFLLVGGDHVADIISYHIYII